MLSWLYKHIARPVLFTQDAEFIHTVTVRGLQCMSVSSHLCGLMHCFCQSPELPVSLFGLRFPNPVGLAAGMDKAGIAV